jgi:hypothetical protein
LPAASGTRPMHALQSPPSATIHLGNITYKQMTLISSMKRCGALCSLNGAFQLCPGERQSTREALRKPLAAPGRACPGKLSRARYIPIVAHIKACPSICSKGVPGCSQGKLIFSFSASFNLRLHTMPTLINNLRTLDAYGSCEIEML